MNFQAEQEPIERHGPPVPGHAGSERARTPSLVTFPNPPNKRWHELDEAERRQQSATIAQQEVLGQNLAPFATAEQHRRISAILAGAVPLDIGVNDERA